jgi:Penicillin binding protein transpeptidase domain
MKRIVTSLALLASFGCGVSVQIREPRSPPASSSIESCFLLFGLGVGEVRRGPADACRTRITPASTFKVPHALAALDTGVISGPDDKLPYDGSGQWPESAARPHFGFRDAEFRRLVLSANRAAAWPIHKGSRSYVFVSCVIGPQGLEAQCGDRSGGAVAPRRTRLVSWSPASPSASFAMSSLPR